MAYGYLPQHRQHHQHWRGSLTIKENAPDQVRTWEDNAEQFGRRGRSFMGDGDARTWEDNADDFAALDNGEGWPFALLVTASVFTGKATDKINSTAVELGKTQVIDFAKRAATSDNRIKRYLIAWDAAAADGHCRSSSELMPTDALTEPLPPVPFSKSKGGYYEATNGVGGGKRYNAGTVAQAISDEPKLAKEIAKSADAVKTILDQASPTVIAAVMADVGDTAFESVNEAIVAVTTPVDIPEIDDTGVTAAYQPSPKKVASAHKAYEQVHKVKVDQMIKNLIATAPPKQNPKPDGYISPAQELLKKLLAKDELWNTEVVIHWLDKTLEAVLAYPGPLDTVSEEFIAERLEVMKDRIAKIEAAVEAKKGSTVPDTIPDNWS
jgi:hypothetical protein